MESKEDRFNRYQNLIQNIVLHKPENSFSSLIENNLDYFRGFKVMYSTNNTKANLGYLQLSEIEKKCSTIKKYFYGTGLLFYTDEIYKKHLDSKDVGIVLDYSLSLDSNAAEYFRIWENGGNLDTEKERFECLVRFIKDGESDGFNFDYSFFILENLLDSLKEENKRPLNSIRALKRFDHLSYDKNDFDIWNPCFDETRETAEKRALNAIESFQESMIIKDLLLRRKVLYVVFIKAVLLNLDDTKSMFEKMTDLLTFMLDEIGKFAKTEFYSAWKMLKYGDSFPFFEPARNLNHKTIRKIRGMSWDLFAYRYQEVLLMNHRGEFFIPFFASFDKRYIELSHACPIRAVVIDEVNNVINTCFLDELEFQLDLQQAMELN